MQLPIYNPTDLSDAALITAVHEKKCPTVMQYHEKIIKVFYRRKLFSQRTLFPSGKSFVRHSQCLLKKNVPTIQVERYLRCAKKCCEIVIYPCLKGQTLRERFEQEDVAILQSFARYLAELHRRGIFFRGLHAGNVLCHEEQFILIDISDLRCTVGSLFSWQRARNLRHFLLYPDDQNIWTQHNINLFIDAYSNAAQSLNNLPATLNVCLKYYGVLVS
jgi:hypothetical protein